MTVNRSKSKGIKIFTGNANPVLAKAIANELRLELGKIEVSAFKDGETQVSIGETVRGFDVFIVQPTCKPANEHLMELLIMIDACKRASAQSISAVIPYYGYARQDRKMSARDPISAKLVANLITMAGADRVLTMDLHAPQIQGFFDIPLDHLQGAPLLLSYYLDKFAHCLDDVTIVAPDIGSVATVRKFAKRFNAPLALIDKRRPHPNASEVMNIVGDVRDRIVILPDDMIDTAGTISNAAAALIEKGGAREVYVGATHAVLSHPAIERIENSVIKEVLILDTIPLSDEAKACKKIVLVSVAPLFAEAIDRIIENEPVSPLFL